jgi:hypothetical protein
MARIGGLGSFLLAAIWTYGWEALRSFLYGEGFNAMSSVGADTLFHWGVPLLLIAVGLALFFKDSRLDWELAIPFCRVPLHVAARRVYEAGEKAGVLDLMLSKTESAENKLNHFKMLMMVDDRVRLFGIKPPSTKPFLIPKSELHGELYPSEGETSELRLIVGSDPEYVNVTVPRSDLRSIIKIYLSEYVDEAKQLRAGKWPH